MAAERSLIARAEGALVAARLRADGTARYAEVDLLVAALRDHICDLQAERDALLRQVSQLRDEARRERAHWLGRGLKPPR